MLRAFFAIDNPFPPEPDDNGLGRDFVVWEPRIKGTKNKAFSFQITKFPAFRLCELSLDLNWRGSDHAGPRLEIDVLGLYIGIMIYDTRHWDYENDQWDGR